MNDASRSVDSPGARLAAALEPCAAPPDRTPANFGASTALFLRNRLPARHAALGQAITEV